MSASGGDSRPRRAADAFGRALRGPKGAVAVLLLGAVLLARLLAYGGDDDAVIVFDEPLGAPASAEKVALPRLVGRAVTSARDFAWQHSLVLVEVYTVASELNGRVMVQSPLPDMRVRSGDTLTVTVSLGREGVPVPTDPRVVGRPPLRLTPIGMGTVAARETLASRRRGPVPTPSPRPTIVFAPPAEPTLATPSTRPAGAASGAERGVAGPRPTVTPTHTATAGTPTPVGPTATPTPEAGAVPPRPDDPRPTRPAPATDIPGPPEPPTPPPPPEDVSGAGGFG